MEYERTIARMTSKEIDVIKLVQCIGLSQLGNDVYWEIAWVVDPY